MPPLAGNYRHKPTQANIINKGSSMTGIHPQRQRVLSTQWTDLTKTSTTAATALPNHSLELVDIHDNTTAMTD
eukprot:scaffold96247_cov81-Cyclotella_meneghiniana.AAC.1